MVRDGRQTAAGRSVLTILTAFGVLAGAALAGAAPAGAVPLGKRVAPGVTYRQFDISVAAGRTRGHLLTVDLNNPHVRLDLLYPGAVAARAAVSKLADSAGAVAGVNGDFFNITETQHPGVEATGATVGPAIADEQVLKAAVPTGQRFGPALPPGTTTTDVFGVGTDRRPRSPAPSPRPRGGSRSRASTSTRCRRIPSAPSPHAGAVPHGCARSAARTRTGLRRAARTPMR